MKLNDCFNTSVIRAKINLDNELKIFSPTKCVKKTTIW